MDKTKINQYGDELYNALKTLTPVDPLTDRESGITIEDAYQIQLRMIQRQIDDGHTVVGKKIGVTSKVVMDMLKVNQPDFGQLLSNMVFNEGEPIRRGADCPGLVIIKKAPSLRAAVRQECDPPVWSGLEGPGGTAVGA